ncbi:MAG: BlaI/MecI/CopY family transcriptional regulator [Maricaulaceae bacterium]|jgi:predicted transcriptional regulator
MADKDVRLTEVQLAVMRALWEAGKASTSEVYERAGKPRRLAYTTVATLLARLEKRGLVKSAKAQGERVFEPLVTEDEATRSMVSSLVDTVFKGDPAALLSHLVREEELGAGDLDTIRKMLGKGSKNDG